MSLSPGLYKAYGTLYDKFSTDLFTFEGFRKTTGLKGSRSRMADAAMSPVNVGSEKTFFFRNGFGTDVSLYPMTEEELGRFYPIMLDVLDQGVIIYERGEILSRAARSMKDWLSAMRVRRVTLKSGWMWLLPPDLKVGEPVGVQKTVKGIPRPS